MKIKFIGYALACALACASSYAALYDVTVLRVGDGVGALGSAAEPLSLLSFATDGTAGGTMLAGTHDAPSSNPFSRVVNGGNFNSLGQLNLSVDGKKILFSGYGAAPGVNLALSSSPRTTAPIVLASFDLAAKTFNTSTRLTNVMVPGTSSGTASPRGVASIDGSAFWFGGYLSGGTGYGVVYAPVGSATGVNILSVGDYASADVRILNFDHTLYFSRMNGSSRGIHVVSGDLATTAASRTATKFSGTGWNASDGEYTKFDFLDSRTLFVADAAAGQIQVFAFDESAGTLWSKLHGANQALNAQAPRQFDAHDNGDGTAVVFFTTQQGTPDNALYSVSYHIASGTFGTPQLLRRAGSGYTFNGIVITAVDGVSPATVVPDPPTLSDEIPFPPFSATVPSTPFDAPEGTWTVAVLPDTQYYSRSYPQVFLRQTEWIAAHKDTRNIRFVLHEGDIVNNPNTLEQWNRARAAFNVLNNAQVPYLLVPGNHDTGSQNNGTTQDRFTRLNNYFSASDYSGGLAKGFFENGKMENSWRRFSTPWGNFLVVGLEFGPRDTVLQWANNVVAANPDDKVIIVTHSYLNSISEYSDSAEGYPLAETGSVNGGQEIWDKFVSKHPNILFVLSGHIGGDGTGYLASDGAGGQTVHQILANYQAPAERLTGSGVVDPHRGYGGGGYLRLLEFWPDGKTVRVRSYSPWYDKWLTEPDQDFTVEVDAVGAPPSQVTRVVSRMGHEAAGVFDRELPREGPPAVESRRNPGGSFTVVFIFDQSVQSATAVLTAAAGAISQTQIAGREVRVHLSGVNDAQPLMVEVGNVLGTTAGSLPGSASVIFKVLQSDVTGDGMVNDADVEQVKGRLSRTLEADNASHDVNASGTLNTGDVLVTKSRIGSSVP